MKRLIVVMGIGLVAGISAVGRADVTVHEEIDCARPAPDDLETCVADRREAWKRRGMVGILVHPEEPIDGAGRWRVHRTAPGGSAEEAGILAGDVIVVWGGDQLPVADAAMVRALEAVRVGDPLAVVVEREGVERTFELQARPATTEQHEYWLLSYVHEHFPDDVFHRYEAQAGLRLVPAGQPR